MLNYGYVITDQKTTNSVNTIIMLLCSCRKMCTFAAKIAQNGFKNMNFVFLSVLAKFAKVLQVPMASLVDGYYEKNQLGFYSFNCPYCGHVISIEKSDKR